MPGSLVEPKYWTMWSAPGLQHYCCLEVIAMALNLLLGLSLTRQEYFDNRDSWFRRWVGLTNARLASQKKLSIDSQQVRLVKSNMSRAQQDTLLEHEVLDMFCNELDDRIKLNNELEVDMDNLLETHVYGAEVRASTCSSTVLHNL